MIILLIQYKAPLGDRDDLVFTLSCATRFLSGAFFWGN